MVKIYVRGSRVIAPHAIPDPNPRKFNKNTLFILLKDRWQDFQQ